MGKLDNVTWTNYKPLPFFDDNNSTVPLQKGGRGSRGFTAEETSCTNDSITFFNVDNSTLYNEGNVYGNIDISVIERTFENDYIHRLYGPSKESMYR